MVFSVIKQPGEKKELEEKTDLIMSKDSKCCRSTLVMREHIKLSPAPEHDLCEFKYHQARKHMSTKLLVINPCLWDIKGQSCSSKRTKVRGQTAGTQSQKGVKVRGVSDSHRGGGPQITRYSRGFNVPLNFLNLWVKDIRRDAQCRVDGASNYGLWIFL